jgi:hypothetical protein
MGTRAALGPSLPALLRRRFGISPAVTLLVVGVIGLVGAVAIVVAIEHKASPGGKLVHEGKPVFNILYPPAAMHEARPRTGELARIQGHRGKLTVSIVVRPLRLPPYRGDATHGQLPVYADRFADAQAAALSGFELAFEGRARVNNGVGYEIGFQSLRPTRREYGRDALLVPDDLQEGGGLVTLSLRQIKAGGAKFTKRERNLAFLSRKTYRSFTFGTGRS